MDPQSDFFGTSWVACFEASRLRALYPHEERQFAAHWHRAWQLIVEELDAVEDMNELPLTPRTHLFANPKRAGMQISADGQWLTWLVHRVEIVPNTDEDAHIRSLILAVYNEAKAKNPSEPIDAHALVEQTHPVGATRVKALLKTFNASSLSQFAVEWRRSTQALRASLAA